MSQISIDIDSKEEIPKEEVLKTDSEDHKDDFLYKLIFPVLIRNSDEMYVLHIGNSEENGFEIFKQRISKEDFKEQIKTDPFIVNCNYPARSYFPELINKPQYTIWGRRPKFTITIDELVHTLENSLNSRSPYIRIYSPNMGPRDLTMVVGGLIDNELAIVNSGNMYTKLSSAHKSECFILNPNNLSLSKEHHKMVIETEIAPVFLFRTFAGDFPYQVCYVVEDENINTDPLFETEFEQGKRMVGDVELIPGVDYPPYFVDDDTPLKPRWKKPLGM